MFRFIVSAGKYMGSYLISVPFMSTFFFSSKSKKIVNITCSGAIRDHKTSIHPEGLQTATASL